MSITGVLFLADRLRICFHLAKPSGIPDVDRSLEVLYESISRLPTIPERHYSCDDPWGLGSRIEVVSTLSGTARLAFVFHLSQEQTWGQTAEETIDGPYVDSTTPGLVGTTEEFVVWYQDLPPSIRGTVGTVVRELETRGSSLPGNPIAKTPHGIFELGGTIIYGFDPLRGPILLPNERILAEKAWIRYKASSQGGVPLGHWRDLPGAGFQDSETPP